MSKKTELLRIIKHNNGILKNQALNILKSIIPTSKAELNVYISLLKKEGRIINIEKKLYYINLIDELKNLTKEEYYLKLLERIFPILTPGQLKILDEDYKEQHLSIIEKELVM